MFKPFQQTRHLRIAQLLLALIALPFAGCGSSSDPHASHFAENPNPAAGRTPVNASEDSFASPTAASGFLPNGDAPDFLARPHLKADFLIYDGTGVDSTDTQALVAIIKAHGLTQRTITEKALNALDADEFAEYGTFIWPGGDNEEMDAVIKDSARKQLRKAVIQKGLNYVGICAGAFEAVGRAVGLEETPARGLALLNGTFIDNYIPPGGEPISMVWSDFPNGSKRHLVFWYGPYFETTKGVIARYSATGKPAMIEGRVGHSMVVLSGPHPEAPASWRTDGNLVDQDGLDTDLAWKLIEAAHTQRPLPTF